MELTNNLSEKALYDYKVVKRAITGDEQAYAELFKRYKDSVYFMILKMVNNRTDAEDLMFEAFEKAFTSLNYYSPQFAFSLVHIFLLDILSLRLVRGYSKLPLITRLILSGRRKPKLFLWIRMI